MYQIKFNVSHAIQALRRMAEGQEGSYLDGPSAGADTPWELATTSLTLTVNDGLVVGALDQDMAEAPAHIERLMREHAELKNRIAKLRTFVEEGPAFSGLMLVEQGALVTQLGVMETYEGILAARLDRAGYDVQQGEG